jgi:para-aminobenzoate synthetase component 1
VRPAILEGRWLNQDGSEALVALEPVSVLEGGAEALGELPAWLKWHADRFSAGAAIGFLSYELAASFESLTLSRLPSWPDISFAYYSRLARARRALPCLAAPDVAPVEVRARFDEQTFSQAVETIQGYLAAGDIYQANLTQRFSASLADVAPGEIYDQLSRGRAPFRAFLRAPAGAIVSNSPERFFRVSGRRILASPIKGTIARSADPADDGRIISNLLSSVKDRAENIMIVDLLRNDLGRVCHYHTIEARLFEVLPLPQLFHLVSHVRGTLLPQVGLVELLRALFPCGSVTGAPKIRAMEVLAEIEKVPRGISMGSIGIVLGDPRSERCQMDFNVAIRTILVQDELATFNVGGGIVYDSNPQSEYQEMMLKAQPLLEAIGAVAAGKPAAIVG